MRESMARLTPRFSSNRAVREYTEQHYLPAAATYHERAGKKGEIGVDIANWRHALDQKWTAIRFGEVKLETNSAHHVFEVQVYLADLDPAAVRVELYADGIMGGAPVRQEMKRVRELVSASGGYVYSAAVSATRPPADYTARVIPHRDGVAIPLEDPRILWQRWPDWRKKSTIKEATAVTCLLLDIGGVLLTNGWDHQTRERAAIEFDLELAEMEIGITWP
jgi:starch phosphorylase